MLSRIDSMLWWNQINFLLEIQMKTQISLLSLQLFFVKAVSYTFNKINILLKMT